MKWQYPNSQVAYWYNALHVPVHIMLCYLLVKSPRCRMYRLRTGTVRYNKLVVMTVHDCHVHTSVYLRIIGVIKLHDHTGPYAGGVRGVRTPHCLVEVCGDACVCMALGHLA